MLSVTLERAIIPGGIILSTSNTCFFAPEERNVSSKRRIKFPALQRSAMLSVTLERAIIPGGIILSTSNTCFSLQRSAMSVASDELNSRAPAERHVECYFREMVLLQFKGKFNVREK